MHTDASGSAVIAVRASCAAGAVVFFAFAIDTMRKYTGEVSGVVLAWVWFVFGAVCAIATVQSYRGRRYTASLAWCLTAVVFNAATCLYIAGYDWYRTPVHQVFIDYVLLAVAVVELACARWLFRRWYARPDRSRLEVRSLLSLVPILGLFGAWYSYVYQPHNSEPLVTVTAQLTADRPHDGLAAISGLITLQNIGKVDAGVVDSLYTVTAHGLDSSRIPASLGAAGDELRIADAVTDGHVLEPFGPDENQLETPLPTAVPNTALVALDEVTPGYFFLAPQESFQRRFAFNLPDDTNGISLDLNVSVMFVNGILNDFHTCDHQLYNHTYRSLVMQTNTRPQHGYFTCVEASLPARTPIGSLVGDHPGLRAYVIVGQPNDPATASAELLGVFSVNGHAVSGNLGAAAAQAAVLQKFAPTDFGLAQDQIEVPGP